MVVLVVVVVMVVGWLIGLLFLFLEGESLFLSCLNRSQIGKLPAPLYGGKRLQFDH